MVSMRLLFFLLVLLCLPTQASTDGISDDEIVLGMSNALSGPTAKLGTQLRQGAQVYFDFINSQGGIHGRKIRIHSLDDGYEPMRTVENTRTFIRNNQVFALFGYVGTPTSHAIMEMVKSSGVPYLMPFTGAEFLRTPVTSNIFNLRASYYQEAMMQINYLVDTLAINHIGLLIQADEFGLSVEQGLIKAMNIHGVTPAVTVRYRRNTEDIDNALRKLKEHNVDAVAFVGTHKPMSTLINKAYQQEFTPFYTTVSFVSSEDLFTELKHPSKVLVTEVVPNPNKCKLMVCQQFNFDMNKAGVNESNHVQFEGYLNAYLFSEVAQRCGKRLTRACLLKEFSQLDINLGGLDVKFSDNDHQGMDNIFISFYNR